MSKEIFKNVLFEEAQALLDAINYLNDNEIQKSIELILSTKGKVIVCGVGKSGLIGAKIAATLASTGTPSFFIHPTEAMHGDLGMIQKGDIVIAISYSGESEEILTLIPHLKRLQIPLIAMSCLPYSSLVQESDAFLSIRVNKEACPLNAAPTSSSTLTLSIGDALAIALMYKRNFSAEDFASFHPGGSLGRRLFIKVKDIMKTDNLPLVSPEMPLREAIVIMSKGCLGNAILVKNNKLYGILSDGDLRRAMMRSDFCLDNQVVEYATVNPYYCDDENRLAREILQEIETKKIQLLVITDSNKHIIGVVHLHHLIEAKIK